MGDGPDRGADIQMVINPFDGQPPVAGRFEVLTEIGAGPLGRVYLGTDLKTGDRVAIKVMNHRMSSNFDDPACVARFRAAARAAMKVTHPKAVRVLEVGEVQVGGTPAVAVVMQHVQARTLADLVATEGALPAERAVDLIDQVCAVLEHAHERGVLHLDLHPLNVLVQGSDMVRVTDFAMRGAFQDDLAPDAPEDDPWLPPEQRTGGVVDEASDVYGLGLLLQHVLTARPPRVPPTGMVLPNDLHRVVEKAVREDPTRRFPDVGAFRAALRDPLLERTPPPVEPILAQHPEPPALQELARDEPASTRGFGPPVYIAAVLILAGFLMVCAGLLWVVPWGDTPAPPTPSLEAAP